MQQQFKKSGVVGKMGQIKDNLIDDGKSSFQIGLDVAAGQAALSILRAFVVPVKVSLVDRLTGKGALIKKVANSTYGSLAIAATFHVVASIVGNDKLSRIAKLALNAATVEAASTLPIQQWVDNIADKMFNNSAVTAVLSGTKSNADKED